MGEIEENVNHLNCEGIQSFFIGIYVFFLIIRDIHKGWQLVFKMIVEVD